MGNNADYPRTLIVGALFSETSGSGTFLGRLFSAWPVDRLASVCREPLPPDWSRCRRHYRVGDLEYRLMAPFNRLVPARSSGPMLPPSGASSPSRAASSADVSLSRRLARYPWRALLRLLRGGEVLYRVGPSPQLLAWAREFQPAVLYGNCSDLNSVLFLRRVQQALNLPFVPYFMDDFSGTLYRGGWAAKLLRPRYQAEFADLVRSAHVALAICQEMAEEYQQRYGRPLVWLPMPVELDAYQAAARTQWTAGRPFRLQYAGRVAWAVRESLVDIARAVHSLRQEGADVVFDLLVFHTEDVPPACLAASGVSVGPAVPPAELPRARRGPMRWSSVLISTRNRFGRPDIACRANWPPAWLRARRSWLMRRQARRSWNTRTARAGAGWWTGATRPPCGPPCAS